MFLHVHTHTQRLTALFLGVPRSAATRKVKPIWILLEQETVSGSGISWAICKSAPCSRQITMPVPHYSKFFTGRMPFLLPNQQRQCYRQWFAKFICYQSWHSPTKAIMKESTTAAVFPLLQINYKSLAISQSINQPTY